MSEEEKTVRSSEVPEAAVPSAPPEAHPASGNSPAAVVSVRTLQDVQRDIQKESEQLDQARKEFRAALSAYDDAWTASRREPTNTSLSEDLAKAKESKDDYKRLLDSSEKLLEDFKAERAELQAAAKASSSEQKSTFLFRAAQYCISLQYCNLGVCNFMIFR